MRYLITHILALIILAASLNYAGGAGLPSNPIPSPLVHPSLLLMEAELPQIKERTGRDPYSQWWSTANELGASLFAERNDIEWMQGQLAPRARAAAFCYLVTGQESYARYALWRMGEIAVLPDAQWKPESHLRLSIAASYFAEAYDALLPWMTANQPDQRVGIADTLHSMGLQLRTKGPVFKRVQKNNHGIRQYSALAIVALALRDDPAYSADAASWLNTGVTNCLDQLRYQICDPDEGGFAEGMTYLAYSGETMWAMFYALRNITGRDLWAEKDIRNLHIYAARTRMPTGCWPMFDDCVYGYFPCAMFTDAYPDDAGLFSATYRYIRAAYDAGYGESGEKGRIAPSEDPVLSIIHFDDTITPQPPVYTPLEVLEKAGDAVFRKGDNPEGIYLNFRVEDERVAFNGGGHEQQDALSFSVQAYGEDLILDPGYINWAQRNLVASSDNHNMITVDGNGPAKPMPGVPMEGIVTVNAWGLSPNPYIEATSSYQGATVIRRIEFVDNAYFIITDTITSDVEHTITLNLHGNAGEGAGGKFSLDGDTATWERTRGGVICKVTCSSPDAQYKVDKDEHSFAGNEWSTHSALRVSAKGKSVSFTTEVSPFKVKML